MKQHSEEPHHKTQKRIVRDADGKAIAVVSLRAGDGYDTTVVERRT